jgi:hypothetical protein
MKNTTVTALEHTSDETRLEVIADLRELIIALDRRVPRLEDTGELDIARDAVALRREALARIAALQGSSRTKSLRPERRPK